MGKEIGRAKAALTRETMIDTALGLLDEVGLDGLTVRRLAAELDIKSPSLYWHIRTKQELLDGLADTIIQRAGMGPPRHGESWRDWLARRSRQYRRSVLAHRDGARLIAAASWLSPATIAAFDSELAAMVDRGFTPGSALHAIATLNRYVSAFVLQEQNAATLSARTSSELEHRAAWGALDVASVPTLLQAIREGGSLSGDAAFERGLQIVLDGIAAVVDTSSAG